MQTLHSFTQILLFLYKQREGGSLGMRLLHVHVASSLIHSSMRASPSYSKRERGSGERSYTRLSLWNAISMFECDAFGHSVHIYMAHFGA